MEQSARSVRPGHRVTVAILKEATYNHYLFIISWMYKRRQIRRDDVLIQLASTDAFDCLRKQLIEGIRIWFIDVRSTNSPWKCPLKKGNMLNLSMLINMLWGTVEQNEYSHLISINQMDRRISVIEVESSIDSLDWSIIYEENNDSIIPVHPWTIWMTITSKMKETLTIV